MIPCAYCEVMCEPTREHVIPNWYIENAGIRTLETFNARNPVNQTRGAVEIKDVCEHCNNIILGGLDQHGKTIYVDFCRVPVFYGESLEFFTDLSLLQRWLLKLCYNSGRVHNSDVTILRDYRRFILGRDSCPADIRIYVHLITPTDFSTHPATAARRPKVNGDRIGPAKWFRLTQMRLDPSFLTDIIQRQVYIDGLCFSLLVPSPGNERHRAQIEELAARFESVFPLAQPVPRIGSVQLNAGELHAASTMFGHIDHHPTRYGLRPTSETPDFGSLIATMARGETKVLAFQVSREEIVENDTSRCRECLLELVADRESAMSALSRLVIFTDGFDDDPRSLWEIPEVRTFFQQLFDQCPFVLCLLLPESETIDLLALCCCRHTVDQLLVTFDEGDVRAFLFKAFRGMNSTMQRLAISSEVNRQITDKILARFRGASGGGTCQ